MSAPVRERSIVLEVNQQDELLRKTVKMVHSLPRGGHVSVLQRKMLNAWLKFSLETPRDAKGWWSMPLSVLRRETGFTSENIKHLREAATGLMGIRFELDVFARDRSESDWAAHVLFPSVSLSRGLIRWTINEALYPEIARPEVYALINMAIMRRFSTNAALQLWEFCVRFENVGQTKRMSPEDFRDLVMGKAEMHSFSEYKVLKRRVITPAIAEINERSEHLVELLEHKVGRRVEQIQFTVARKHQGEALPVQALPLVERMVQLGVAAPDARRLALQYDAGRIHDALRYTEMRNADPQKNPLDLPAAYFRKALEQGYGAALAPAAEATVSASAPAAAPTPASAPAAKKPKAFDLREAFGQRRRDLAKDYFAGLDAERKTELQQAYNAQQTVPAFRVKARLTKGSEVAFLNWLALQQWGEPSLEDIVKFSEELLSGQGG
jgi:hypothetical protein